MKHKTLSEIKGNSTAKEATEPDEKTTRLKTAERLLRDADSEITWLRSRVGILNSQVDVFEKCFKMTQSHSGNDSYGMTAKQSLESEIKMFLQK